VDRRFFLSACGVILEISARIGRVTGAGIAGNIRRYHSKPILYIIVSLLLIANICNLGADIGAWRLRLRTSIQ
jgi:Mn2+/Fe2+ NRAMP family transporter